MFVRSWIVSVFAFALLVGVGCTDDAIGPKGGANFATADGGNNSATTNSQTGGTTPNSGNSDTDAGNNSESDGGGNNTTPGACAADADCADSANGPFCAPNGRCVSCIEGDANATCSDGLTCCGNSCVDTQVDTNNCGQCGDSCMVPEGTPRCVVGDCRIGSCPAGFNDCDGDPSNGCEVADADGGCECVPGNVRSCYSGPGGTEGVGICTGGTQVCNDEGTGFGPCDGEVVPEMVDTCDDDLDNDCNGTANDGFDDGAPSCVCTPGFMEPCYEGPAGTEGVGACTGGMRTCEVTGRSFRFCAGQVVPELDTCGNGVDEDCDGTADNPPDQDGDGWTICDGDCCDDTLMGCADPALVNPGALEFAGNQVDDDCDGMVDNTPSACDAGLMSNSSTGLDYARAMDLCQTTTETAPIGQRRWGVISAGFSLADGTGSPNAAARSIRPAFGANIVPLEGSSLASLSTGTAAFPSSPAPSYSAVQPGLDVSQGSGPPVDWLAANGGSLPNAPGCPAPQGGNTANDPVMLTLRVRVPTNANSFSFNSYFLSSEYPEWVCSAFNDFFVVLLDSTFSGMPANPADKNLAVYTDPMGVQYPVGVNLAFGDTGLFTQCLNGSTGCGGGAVSGTTSTCTGTLDLAGTGFDQVNAPPAFANDPSGCGASNLAGGGTGWLTTSGNVVPGEIIDLRIMVWDTGDGFYDSTALLDNFVWNVNASNPGTD